MESRSHKDFYDHISSFYDALADANEHTARELGERMLDVQPGERVLEIGFGTGNTILHLAKAAGENGSVIGVDVSEGMRSIAEPKVSDAGLSDRIELLVGDAVSLDIPDDSIDAAFMSFTLELFPEAEAASVLQELKRVLKPDGRFATVSMATVGPDERESVLEWTYQWTHRHFPHIVDCRPIDVGEVVTAAGFQVQQEERIAIWTMPVSAVVALNNGATE